jgi:serine/threonine protein kinase
MVRKTIFQLFKFSIYKDPIWKKRSDLVKDFIKKLMNVNSEERLTAKEALEHPWIQQKADVEPVDEKITQQAFQNLSQFRVCFLFETSLSHQFFNRIFYSQSKSFNKRH